MVLVSGDLMTITTKLWPDFGDEDNPPLSPYHLTAPSIWREGFLDQYWDSNYTWNRQLSQTVDALDGVGIINCTGGTTGSALLRTMPGAPWTATVCLAVNGTVTDFHAAGLVLRDPVGGKCEIWYADTRRYRVLARWTTVSAWSSSTTTANTTLRTPYIWLRIVRPLANNYNFYSFQWSGDGFTWIEAYYTTQLHTDWVTATEIGLWWQSQSGAPISVHEYRIDG